MSHPDFWTEANISLLPEEKILYTSQPNRDAIFRSSMILAFLVSICLGPFLILMIPLLWWSISWSSKRHQAWVTNRRVIVTNGMIGYTTRSVPLERISDVQIGCSWTERLCNIRSIIVRDMTGEAQGGARMQGITDVHEVQKLILEEVHRVNLQSGDLVSVREENPVSETVSHEMVAILKEIRDVLREK